VSIASLCRNCRGASLLF